MKSIEENISVEIIEKYLAETFKFMKYLESFCSMYATFFTELEHSMSLKALPPLFDYSMHFVNCHMEFSIIDMKFKPFDMKFKTFDNDETIFSQKFVKSLTDIEAVACKELMNFVTKTINARIKTEERTIIRQHISQFLEKVNNLESNDGSTIFSILKEVWPYCLALIPSQENELNLKYASTLQIAHTKECSSKRHDQPLTKHMAHKLVPKKYEVDEKI